jgi:hypothetical protein
MEVIYTNRTKHIEAGTYYIIDPCYVLQNIIDWGEYCKACFPNEHIYINPLYILLKEGDKTWTIPTWGTNSGDGVYPVFEDGYCKEIGECGVDAGVLSFIPQEVVKMSLAKGNDLAKDGDLIHLGVRIALEYGGTPVFADGDCRLGNFRVITSGNNKNLKQR